MSILIPLYNYPITWDTTQYIWDEVAAANSSVPIVAIINPNNGPDGGPPNSDYQYAMNDLRSAGVKMLGYVLTDWGNRPIEAAKADVDLYANHFNVNGIFLDEAASGTDKLGYYSELYSYIKSKPGLSQVVINPGINVAEGYVSQPASDTAVIFEHQTGWQTYTPDPYVWNYPAQRFSMMAYEVPDVATMHSYVDLARARNIGYVYVTNDGGGNPWDTLPTYWGELVAYVAQGNVGR